MIKVLLEAGANPDVPGERTPKVLKTNNRTPDASLLFGVVRNNSSRYPLLLATELGHVEAVKMLLSGFTALYIAALQFHINLIEILLRNGAQSNKKVINTTPFTYILSKLQGRDLEETEKREEILCMMLNYGANANALVTYISYSNVKHVQALLFVINSVVKYETVKEMVIGTADLDAMDAHGIGATHKAAVCGR